MTFKELGVDERIIQGISEIGFENPMPIQEKVIPWLLGEEVRDIVALAQTGTGKTAVFGIPIIQKTKVKSSKVQSLILCPTRELCMQIEKDIIKYAKYVPGIRTVAVYGGASMDKQIQQIRKGVQIISATPGRLKDLLNRNIIDLSQVSTMVLDEADEMLNMGFQEDLEEILMFTPGDKNTLLFSATMPQELMEIAKKYMNDPIELSVGKRNAGAEDVEHIAYFVHSKDRYLALKRIVDFNPDIYGIVFCRTRRETQEIADKLIQDGYDADALHGDLSQVQRDAVMEKFRIKHLQLLVATDVAARGLDVYSLTHIVNYNMPDELEIYTHRSGRTGRAGKKGVSIIIANMKEKGKLHQIEKNLGKKFSFQSVPLGKDICEKQLLFLIDKVETVEVDYTQIQSYLTDAIQRLDWLEREELIARFLSVEFNRFLDYYKNTPDLNHPVDEKRGRVRGNFDGYTRYFINIGKMEDLKPTTLIGLINETTGKRDMDIGEIEILKNFSFFEVESGNEDLILMSFEGKEYQGRRIGVEVASAKEDRKRGGGGGGGKRRERSGGEKREGRGFSGDRRKSGERSFGGGRKSGERSFGDRKKPGERSFGDRKKPGEGSFGGGKRDGEGSSERKSSSGGGRSFGGKRSDKKERFSSDGDKGKRKPRWKK